MIDEKLIIIRVVKELRGLIEGDDLSLSTRLMLDFLTDAELEESKLEKAIGLRAKFNHLNNQREKASKEDFLEIKYSLISILDEIEAPLKLVEETLEAQGKVVEKVQPQYFYGGKIQNYKGQTVFSGRKIGKKYKSTSFRLNDININLLDGGITGMVGENGNGKTTLLRIIAGELARTSGEINYPFLGDVARNSKKDWYNIKQHIAFIPQHLEKWQGSLKDNLHFSASNHGVYGKENDNRVNFILHRLGLTRYKNAKWNDISSGYKLRFELAKALVWRPRLLVLDEPLANLDINTKLMFMQDLRMLANIKKHPISIIMSSQQLHEIESVVDNIIFLRDGDCIYSGTVADFGDDREKNTIEISGNFTRKELHDILLPEISTTITETGQSFLIDVDKEIDCSKVMGIIFASGIYVEYFRDISKSTRKLFTQK